MKSTHKAKCTAVADRASLIRALNLAIRNDSVPFVYGTQWELDRIHSVLEGIITEYHDDGDQMTENCDCGYIERNTDA